MPIYLVIQVTVHDQAKFMDYVRGHLPTVAQYGGKFIFEGKAERPFEGQTNHHLTVIQEWPSEEAMQTWYDSAEYAPWKKLRQEAASVVATVMHRLH
jgi:uncharacterized protein (DUF1330 family)